MTGPRSKSAARVLGDLASDVYAQIYRMTPRQRRAALRALDRFSSTNCGWPVYAMRDVLRGFVRDASSARTAIRKRGAR